MSPKIIFYILQIAENFSEHLAILTEMYFIIIDDSLFLHFNKPDILLKYIIEVYVIAIRI